MPLPDDYLSISAFICQQVLRDQDGLLSAIRITDSLTLRSSADYKVTDFFAEFYVLVLATKKAAVASTQEAVLELVYPSGERRELGRPVVEFDSKSGEHHPSGSTMIFELRLGIKEAGTHWINLSFDDVRVVSLPLSVRVANAPTG